MNESARSQAIINIAENLANGVALDRDVSVEPIIGRQTVTILVNNLDHARILSQKLPDWPIFVSAETNLTGMPGSLRSRIKRNQRRWLDGSHQIVMMVAACTFDGRNSDVIIWAGGGPHPPAIPGFWFGEESDAHHPPSDR